MKKLLIALVGCLLFVSMAAAEIMMITPYAQNEKERALTDLIARLAGEALQEGITVAHENGVADAADAFLALPADARAFLICPSDALILSLQGYTKGDFAIETQPVACVAASDSRLYASPAALELLRSATEESLIAYTDEHPYELFAARLIDASHTDYLTVKATEDMYTNENLYADYEEMGEAAANGAVDILVMSEAMRPEALDMYQPLYRTALPGVMQCAFARAQASESFVIALCGALDAVKAQSAYHEAVSALGYAAAPAASREAFAAGIDDAVENYTRYLTSEGLFFY